VQAGDCHGLGRGRLSGRYGHLEWRGRRAWRRTLLHGRHRSGLRMGPLRWFGADGPPLPVDSGGRGQRLPQGCNPALRHRRVAALRQTHVLCLLSPRVPAANQRQTWQRPSPSPFAVPRQRALPGSSPSPIQTPVFPKRRPRPNPWQFSWRALTRVCRSRRKACQPPLIGWPARCAVTSTWCSYRGRSMHCSATPSAPPICTPVPAPRLAPLSWSIGA